MTSEDRRTALRMNGTLFASGVVLMSGLAGLGTLISRTSHATSPASVASATARPASAIPSAGPRTRRPSRTIGASAADETSASGAAETNASEATQSPHPDRDATRPASATTSCEIAHRLVAPDASLPAPTASGNPAHGAHGSHGTHGNDGAHGSVAPHARPGGAR